MINGKSFDWQDIKIDTPWGIDIAIKAISYSSSVPSEAVFSRGNTPRAYGQGNLEQEASMDLDHTEFLKLSVYAATQGGFSRIAPFPVTVRYANDDQLPQVDILDGVKLTDIEADSSQGDTETGVKSLTFVVLNPIKFNGVPMA